MLVQQFFKIDDGVTESKRAEVVQNLAQLLADTYTLYLKTHNFHWNVVGPLFPSLHALFETQYLELWAAVDTMAERVRALGFIMPGSHQEFSSFSKVEESIGSLKAMEMVQNLITSHETVLKTATCALKVANDANDQATVDLINQRLDIHSKNLWILRSINYQG